MPENVATNGVNGAATAPKNNVATSVEQQPKKKFRRGITNETRTVARLKFDETIANRSNGLFQAVIDSVEVKDVTINADSDGMPQFAGISIPTFVVNFHSLHDTPEKWRWVTLRLMPAESNAETIPFGKNEWKVTNVLSYIKHLLDVVYLRGRQLTEEEEDALCLPFDDWEEDEQGNIVYVPVEPEVVANGYRQVFNNAAAMLNGTWGLKEGETPKPAYINPDGKRTWLWIKILRFTKNKGKWQPVVRGGNNTGDLGFPTFLGTGVFELWHKDTVPALRIDPIKESIIPQKWEEKAATPPMPGMGIQGGVPVGGPVAAGVNPIFGGQDASVAPDYSQFNDMPFGGEAPF